MCRIIAINGKIQQPLLLELLSQFGRLAESGKVRRGTTPGHKDGWGIAGYKDGIISLREKEVASAARSSKFMTAINVLSATSPDLIVGHLRKASVGGNSIENTQPYWLGNLTFCHNGTVNNFKNIPLSPEYAKLRKGTSDSEWLFLRIAESINSQPSMAQQQKIEKIVHEVRTLDYSAFIIILTDGKNVWVLREVNEQNISVRKDNALDDYYTLFLGTSDEGAKIVCSEKLEIQGIEWRSIKNHELVVITHETSNSTPRVASLLI